MPRPTRLTAAAALTGLGVLLAAAPAAAQPGLSTDANLGARNGSLLDLDADLNILSSNHRYGKGKGGLLDLDLDLDILGGSRYGGYNPYGSGGRTG
ncbi:hypothetical protein HS041_28930 [Planomonospora sp. ID67723]|uniref:hypothetical protein n=1 Tax=Planomonospora sp. ID67723 TaxID=2738134 RepID=UPI0018C3E7F7|nr:hypothetical protein [Planomonospora sp. ID67723]MBG0831747.1 hypothetical protein [Planomonospora sp. ID67723]